MPKISADEILTQQNKRLFIQFGGPGAANAVKYSGKDTQYISLGGVSKPLSGGISAINVPDPNRFGNFKQVGRTRDAADFPSASLEVMQKKGAMPFQLGDMSCPFNIYEVAGQCKTPSDWTTGWTDYVQIYSFVEATDLDLGDRTSFDGDDADSNNLSLTMDKIYAVGGIALGAYADSLVNRSVVDACYGSMVQCGNCGPANDGTKRIYALCTTSGSGSPGLPATVVYSLDSGSTFTSVAITSMGATEAPVQIEVVGSYLVVLVASSTSSMSAIHYATLNSDTGAPGTFTKTQTGFTASAYANSMYVANAREIYFAADNGTVYKSSDITSGVDRTLTSTQSGNLRRIHGSENVLFACGTSDSVCKSVNRGETWAACASSPTSGTTLQALQVMSRDVAWVGSAAGGLYYTLNGGASWNTASIGNSLTGAITDIKFATDEVGYVSRTLSSTAYMYSTWNGGANWVASGAPRILNFPVFDAINRFAIPIDSDTTVAANNILIAALGGDGTDGLLLIGKVATL